MMDDSLTLWCQRWLAKGERPEELARLLRLVAKEMDCRFEAERELKDG